MDRVLFSLGPLKIHYYSLTMLLAVLVGLFLAIRESKHYNIKEYIIDLSTYLIIFGIIGARLYYVIFNFSSYRYRILDIFKIWEGGIAIYGAVIGGFLAILYHAKKNHQSIIKTTDIIVPGLILAQAIGRWGNFFNQEAHGITVTLDFLKKLHLPNFIIEGMYINGNYYHPTFLYESIWCLIGFLILIIFRKLSKRKLGVMTASYFIWYGLGRYFIEGLRTDSLYLGTFRISQIVSILLIITGIVWLIIIYTSKRKEEKNENTL